MNDMTPTSAERAVKLEGMGCKRKRVEDIRFTQGKGNYVDDLKLPGMLYGDLVRSPHAHARIKKIDTTKAAAVPGVVAVITAETLKTVNLAWMPTLAGDVQMVLADGKVLFQNQEVAFVIAENREAAADAVELVEVEYEALPCNVDPLKAMAPNAPVIREDIKDKTEGAHGKRKHYNHIFSWQAGDKAATDAAFAKADVTIREFIVYPRCHPCPLETCQCVASFDKIKGELTLWGTFQAPHVIRTVGSLISKIPEHKIHVIAPDIGGGFGNKVGAYSGYICAIVASIVTGRPVNWVEDRIENLSATAFARDFHMDMEIAATKDGKVTAMRCYTIADHGAFDACANATKWPAGLFSIISGSYDFPAAHVLVDGVYTNKAPGGVAYRCSFRVTEAAYAIERAMDIMAQKLGMDPAEFRIKNLIRREQFPYTSAFGWQYDSGDYHTAMNKAMESVGYKKLREEQKAKREAFKRGETRELMGIGVAFFTEIVGAGPSRACDILGIAMFDSAEIRIHPTGTGICRLGTKSQGQGHETTYAQIIATELGLPADNIMVEEGNTDTAPYGLGTYGSRSTPVSGAATAMACRKIKAKAQMIAAYMLEVHDDDLEWDVDRFRVKGNPGALQDHDGARLGGLPRGAARHGAGARGGQLLRSAELHLPVRRLHLRGGHRRRYRHDQDPALLCTRRLRHAHQSDDHRGPDPRRPDGSLRYRHGPGDPLRRGRQHHDGVVHGLFPADRGRNPALGDRLDHDAVAASPDRRQGRRREPECRRRTVLLQRGERRLRVPRLHAYPDAARPLAHLDGRGQARPAWVTVIPAERALRVRAGIHNHRPAAVARAEGNSYVCGYGFRARAFGAPRNDAVP